MNRTTSCLVDVCALCVCLFILTMLARSAPSPAATNGQHVYARSCASCHDAHSTVSKVGPGLKGYYSSHHPPPSDAKVLAIIVKGKGRMLGFSSLSQEQMDELIAYLKTL